jgi:cell fate regulator YaaT (PSP1 superfamily)
MVALPQQPSLSTGSGEDGHDHDHSSGGCGTSCGSGLEKVYPTVAVRYGAMNWIGEFSYRPGSVFKCGAKVVLQSDRGIELGEQVSLSCGGCEKSVTRDQIKQYVDASGPEFYQLRSGRILREASPQDIADAAHLDAHAREDINRCQLLAAQLDLGMKIVTVEYLFGGERVVYYFRSEDRIDFRELVRELALNHRTRIEMRQVGARDEARLVADHEICGRECCCKNFLKKLRPVTMKMAKLQKSTLDPAKVSGRCGRLRCCLRYEHEGYEELDRKLPRIGKRVDTGFGPGVVIDRQILTQLVVVRTDDQSQYAIPVEEVAPEGQGATLRPAPPVDVVEAPEPPARSERPQPSKPRRGRSRRGPAVGESPAGQEEAPKSAEDAPGEKPEDEGERPRGDGGGQRRRRRRRRRGGGSRPGDSRPPEPNG